MTEEAREDLEQLEEANSPQAQLEERMKKLEMILDIPLKVSVELGRTKMLVNDLLQLGQGSNSPSSRVNPSRSSSTKNSSPAARSWSSTRNSVSV
jgi:hypothetical protein